MSSKRKLQRAKRRLSKKSNNAPIAANRIKDIVSPPPPISTEFQGLKDYFAWLVEANNAMIEVITDPTEKWAHVESTKALQQIVDRADAVVIQTPKPQDVESLYDLIKGMRRRERYVFRTVDSENSGESLLEVYMSGMRNGRKLSILTTDKTGLWVEGNVRHLRDMTCVTEKFVQEIEQLIDYSK